MTNHFTLSDATFQRSKALCPWKDQGDEDYFAEVDGTQTAFDEYSSFAIRQAHFTGGSFHLAIGPEGCGKTSLINRCVSKFQNVNNSAQSREKTTIIIDVSRDVSATVAAAKKGEEVWRLVADELPYHMPTLTQSQIKEITDEKKTITSQIKHLSRCLDENSSSLAVILPQIELEQEFISYFAVMKDHVALFAETTREDMEQHCKHFYGSQSETPVQVMRLHPLAVEDGQTFVANRMMRRTENCPRIEADIINKVMTKRIKGGAGASIRELHLVCEAVYETALKQGKAVVEFEDFSDHYMKCGLVR